MPPRFVYWTIIIDNQPTAFRSAEVEELIPTFNRLKTKQPNAVLKWFQHGQLWDSRLEAQEGMQRRRNEKRGPKASSARPSTGKLEWRPKDGARWKRKPENLAWKPRSEERATKPKRENLAWKPRAEGLAPKPKLDWKPRNAPGTSRPEKPERRERPERERPARRPETIASPDQRDSKWRPGGDHRDPRQKYKDAKKAKWTRFKEAIRRRRPPRKP